MNDHDLHDQLERLGRRPVPPPRPEFVETLLARIQLTDDLSMPSNVIPMRRQRWAHARFAVVGVAAAVLLGAVGMVAVTQGASEPGTPVPVKMVMQSVSGEESTVDETGQLTGPESGAALADGTYLAECREAGTINYETGSIYCETDEVVRVVIEDGRIVSAGAPGVIGNAEQETSTTSGDVSGLELVWESVPGGAKLSWTPPELASAGEVAGYRVLRSPDAAGVVNALDLETTTSYRDLGADATSFDDEFTHVPEGTPQVVYRIVAVDRANRVVADSGTLTLDLRWDPDAPTR